ncbi:LysR family transcriptional regulator [Desulfovibrio sulfodismutans]|uniref:LysR family transcriptional regulator n=1 Tax=Desulfolutivibrio sulfodismutans TaxID=63561 RepID=A0A7K3NTH4_9BACT|nr:LysR family transcriptional regulator [Desulfolutivibrio sulfodismutans]NDY58569.1 LysR family transcriptional regulator [Desulfolutivibrio sulfodismutans]QLA13925.1 LysR family transcriptional regulator [Desulfolutivibrio sulfodismutans DSM 3696]
MHDIVPTQRLHLWLESGRDMFLGLGRVQLLERVEEFGSLNKAAQAMGMSYRAAWGRLKRSESVLGAALVEKTGPKQGFRLTELGRDLVQRFRDWHAEVEAYALTRARQTFPWPIEPFDEPCPADVPGDPEKPRRA